MLNLADLDKIYDPSTPTINTQTQTSGPGDPPKPKPIPSLKDADNPNTYQSLVTIGTAKAVDTRDYGQQLDNGVYSDQDIDSQRGQHQGLLNKIGHGLGNMPLNIIGGLMEGVGDVGLLASQWGDDRTYSNALIDAGHALHNVTGEIYMNNPHGTLGDTLSDPGWWVSQATGLAEMGVSYGLLGAGVGGSISKLAEGTAGLLRAGELSARTLQGFGQMGSAGFMAYTMGASNAAEVFKSTYNTQLRKMLDAGQDPDTAATNAKHIAAQSAATTAQMTTAIGTVLGIGAMAPFFKKADNVAMDILRKKVPQQAGEDGAAWLSRVKAMAPEDYANLLNPSKSMTSKLLEMGKMGVEMQQLQFGQKTGEELGRKGKIKGFLDQFSELDNYLDRTMDKDGALAFATGVVGGMIIHKFTNDIIPSRWADKLDPTTGQPIPKVNSEGEEVGTEKRLYTPKAYSETHTALAFTRMRDAIASDIEQYNKHHNAYLAAVKANDPVARDRTATEMFNINNVSGIINNMGDMWKQTYQQMSEMSPEEATQRGFIVQPEDHTDFVKKAKDASSNMDHYQEIYDKLQDRYGTLYTSNQGYKPVVDGLFARKVHLDGWDKLLKEHEDKLADNTTSENARLSISDPDLFDQHTAEYTRNWDAARKTVDKLMADHKTILGLVDQFNNTDPTKRNNLVQKMAIIAREYSALDPDANNSAESLTKSMSSTTKKIEAAIERQKNRVQESEDSLFSSTGYTNWLEKHPGKTFSEYRDKIYEEVHNSDYQHQIELSREKYKIAEQNIAELEKEKNLTRFANKYNKYLEDELKKSDEFEKEQNRELADRAKGKKVFNQAQRAKAQEMAERYRVIRDEHNKEYIDEHDRLETAKKELEGMANVKDFVRKAGLRSQIRNHEKNLAALKAKIEKYNTLFNEHDTYVAPPTTEAPPVRVDELTINPPTEFNEPTIDTSIDEDFINASDIIDSVRDLSDLAETQAESARTSITEAQEPVKVAEENLMEALTEHINVIDALEGINYAYDQILNKSNFSYDLLNPLIRDNKLTQTQANKILAAFKEYADAIQKASNTEDLIGYKQGEAELMEEDVPPLEVDTIDIDPPSDIPTQISDDPFKIPQIEPDEDEGYAGAKTVNANTVANSTLGFGNNEEGMVSVVDAVNNKTNPDVLKPSKLRAGHGIRFEVDTEYNGPKNLIGKKKGDNSGTESFDDYSDKDGKVPADKMANAPIKIVDDVTGKTIGYVRKYEWVTERENGVLRNIASKYTKEGEEYNGAEQSKKILDLRKQIIDQFNANGGAVKGSITSKGPGHAILNREGFKAKPAYAYNNKDTGLLPDPKLQIVIVNNGSLFSGKGYVFDKAVAGETKDLPTGTIYAMLPSANGQHIPAPLVGKNLGESDVPHRTISRAIELYLSYTGSEEESQTHEIRNLQDKTGHDISTENGLRHFINQYFTHTQSFQDTATISSGKGRSKFLFNVWDKISGKEGKAWIKAGWSESNQKAIYATLDSSGKLSQEFSDLLRDGFKTRSKSVVFTRDGIRGINEPIDTDNPFVDAQYNAAGKWVHPKYSNYNEYVKSFSKTTVYGRNKLGNDYVYTANPSIEYEMNTASRGESPTSIVVENKTTKVNLEPKTDKEKKYQEFEKKDYERKLPIYQAKQKALHEVLAKVKELGSFDKLREWIGSTPEAYDLRTKLEGLDLYSNIIYSNTESNITDYAKEKGIEHIAKGIQDWFKDYELNRAKNDQSKVEEKEYDTSLADEMDNIFNATPFSQQKVNEIGTGLDKSKPLNLKSLEDLYTFTPEEQRNGKVPSDILKELTERGHSFLPDGYNPFSLCI